MSFIWSLLNASLTFYWFLRKSDERNLCHPHWVPNEQAVGSLLLPDTPLAFQILPWVSIPSQRCLLSSPGLDVQAGCLGERKERLQPRVGRHQGPGWGCMWRQWQGGVAAGWGVPGHITRVQGSWTRPYLFSLWDLGLVINFLWLQFSFFFFFKG